MDTPQAVISGVTFGHTGRCLVNVRRPRAPSCAFCNLPGGESIHAARHRTRSVLSRGAPRRPPEPPFPIRPGGRVGSRAHPRSGRDDCGDNRRWRGGRRRGSRCRSGCGDRLRRGRCHLLAVAATGLHQAPAARRSTTSERSTTMRPGVSLRPRATSDSARPSTAVSPRLPRIRTQRTAGSESSRPPARAGRQPRSRCSRSPAVRSAQARPTTGWCGT